MNRYAFKHRLTCPTCNKETTHRVISTVEEIVQVPTARFVQCIECLRVTIIKVGKEAKR